MAKKLQVGNLYPLSMSYLNQYLGAPASKTRSFSGTEQQPINFSINQIFFSQPNTTAPATSTLNTLSLNGKTFGIYTETNRLFLHSSTFTSNLLPAFVGYFGFGTSGFLNPKNRGCPIRIGITPSSTVSINTIFDGAFSSVTAPAGSTTYITRQCDGIQIFSHQTNRVTVNLQASPSLEGTTAGLGIHTINITFPEQDGESDIRPPIDGPPIVDEPR